MSEKKKTDLLSKYILSILSSVLKCSYSFWNGIHNWVLQPIYNNFANNATHWILAVVAIYSLFITYSNNELANRPFVSIENVYWSRQNIPGDNKQDRFSSGATVQNYGNKPAENYTTRNARAIILRVDEPNLICKLNQENKNISLLSDSRNQVHEDTANLLADYFKKNPDANETKVRDFVNSWTKNLPEHGKLKHNNKPLVNYIGGNNDMFDYFSKTTSIIYPGHKTTQRKWQQPMSKKHLNSITVEEGDNFLVLYWIIKYKGQTNKISRPFTPKTYSTCYVGYYFQPFSGKSDLADPNRLRGMREIRSWTMTD